MDYTSVQDILCCVASAVLCESFFWLHQNLPIAVRKDEIFESWCQSTLSV